MRKKKVRFVFLSVIVLMSILALPSQAHAAEKEDCIKQATAIESDRVVYTMSGSGSLSQGSMTIYYPNNFGPGTINILDHGVTVQAIPILYPYGIYTGSCANLTAKTYDLSYIIVDNNLSVTVATGKLYIST
ncbi:MAG: hypothetical protein K5855_05135 [Oscillospiraceae bacterium]|nr:hypothetical protein [Oscillospiraceae bacterium]